MPPLRKEPFTRFVTLVFHQAIELTADDIEQLRTFDSEVKFKGNKSDGYTEIEVVSLPNIAGNLMVQLCQRPVKQ